jgi:hypothetical protein
MVLKRNNPTEALRRVSRVRSILIIGRFYLEIKLKLRGRARTESGSRPNAGNGGTIKAGSEMPMAVAVALSHDSHGSNLVTNPSPNRAPTL